MLKGVSKKANYYEMDYKFQYGLDALKKLLDDAEVTELLDVQRRDVTK